MTTFKGRTLGASAIGYVTDGTGYFESQDQSRQRVVPGTLMIQPAGQWHCHDPDPGTRWTEYWLLYHANAIEPLFGDVVLTRIGSIHIGLHADLISLWEDLYAAWPAFGPGSLEDACLIAHRLFHGLHRAVRSQTAAHVDDHIRDADSRIRGMVYATHFDGPGLAKQLGLGYHTFRRRFQQRMGVGPKQYWLRMRMERAAEYLSNTGMTVEDTARALGFDDATYFSRLFKNIVGTSPGRYRSDPSV